MKMAVFFTFALYVPELCRTQPDTCTSDNYGIMRIAPIVSPAMQELHIAGIPELCISIILVQRELRISGIYQHCAFKLT